MSDLQKIEALSRSSKDSEDNANDIIDLLQYLQSADVEVAARAITEACSVFCHVLGLHYTWLVPVGGRRRAVGGGQSSAAPVAPGDDPLALQYQRWLRKNYTTFLDQLLELLSSHSPAEIQACSLAAVMRLVQAEGHAHQNRFGGYIFPNHLFHLVVSRLLGNQTDRRVLIGHMKEFLQYDDVRLHWLKNIASIVLTELEQKRSKTSTEFIANVHCALRLVRMPAYEAALGNCFTGEPPAAPHSEGSDGGEAGEGGEGEQAPPKAKRSKTSKRKISDVSKLSKHRKHFSEAWLAFLRLPLPAALHKKVLLTLHSEVMAHLLEPRLLIDYLTDSYDAGGVTSLLALNGLFALMHQYHLDYPDFYTKLYALLDSSVLHVKYMPRFFDLLDTFLSSTHLPLYLVAAFAKKIARLSLSAPPNGVMVAVVFVTNLIKRHSNCRVLLHRNNAQDDEVDLSADPYELGEVDPAKSGALESCLWELKTLQSHVCPAVALLLQRLLEPKTASLSAEEPLSKYLDTDHQQLFEECCASAGLETAPLNYHEPNTLW